ncbi:folate family ECF transporter S component [Pseudoflavonifractor phocaeensis]|uniref:folate family ECF transporter S component n=1 Tax=Pseudoflavonifractor phocaeensis TaxID=1870988 RepID=UPI00313D6E9A
MSIWEETQDSSPFSAGYWRAAAADFRKPRVLAFAALMIAACVALSYIPSIPIGDGGVRVTWGFLARSLCGLVGGPVTALVFGFAEDTISFFIHPTGAYFPGYALTTMLGTMIYALFLYRTKVTVVRIFWAKLCTNALNVVLGSLWSAILYSKGYLYYMTTSLVKNVVMLPVQTAMLCFLLAALLPILGRMGFVPGGQRLRFYR